MATTARRAVVRPAGSQRCANWLTDAGWRVYAARVRACSMTLIPGQLVVVDNVGAHQPDRIRELVTAAGCGLVFLPAYSPDLSPIEEAFSKIKALVKAAAARTRAALDAAIAAALNAVTAADVVGWFSHAGYPSRQAA